jgi:hypothetical protein
VGKDEQDAAVLMPAYIQEKIWLPVIVDELWKR